MGCIHSVDGQNAEHSEQEDLDIHEHSESEQNAKGQNMKTIKSKFHASHPSHSSLSSKIEDLIAGIPGLQTVPSQSMQSKSSKSNHFKQYHKTSTLEVINDEFIDENNPEINDEFVQYSDNEAIDSLQPINNTKTSSTASNASNESNDDEQNEEDIDEPLPSSPLIQNNNNDDFKIDETNDDIVDIKKLSEITFKCIQSAHGTKAGTQNGKTKTNQDSFICIDSFGPSSVFQLYGVCDGHGPNGNNVSQFVADHFMEVIDELLTNQLHEMSIPLILKESFKRVEEQLFEDAEEKQYDINYSGTTVTLGLIVGNKLYVANTGDSRTVLGVVDSKGRSVPIPIALSTDHDPTNNTEMLRIKQSNHGKIDSASNRIQIEIPQIIQNENLLCINPEDLGLAISDDIDSDDDSKKNRKHQRTQSQVKKISASVSRSIGDVIAHKYGGLISEPEITQHALSENDIFVIFASDGIWQMIENDDVMRMVGTKLNQNKQHRIYQDLQKTTNKLVREASISWMDEYEDYTDDITVVIARIGKIE